MLLLIIPSHSSQSSTLIGYNILEDLDESLSICLSDEADLQMLNAEFASLLDFGSDSDLNLELISLDNLLDASNTCRNDSREMSGA